MMHLLSPCKILAATICLQSLVCKPDELEYAAPIAMSLYDSQFTLLRRFLVKWNYLDKVNFSGSIPSFQYSLIIQKTYERCIIYCTSSRSKLMFLTKYIIHRQFPSCWRTKTFSTNETQAVWDDIHARRRLFCITYHLYNIFSCL
jgi:hypothetical protein